MSKGVEQVDLHSAACVKRASFLFGMGVFVAKFMGTGSSPAKMLILFDFNGFLLKFMQKTSNLGIETLGYPMVKAASLCIPSFRHNTGVWQTDRQTDGWICHSIYSAKAKCYKNYQNSK